MQMLETVAWNLFILSQSFNISAESKIPFILDNSVLYCAVCNYFHLSVNHNSPIALACCIVSALTRGCSVLSPGPEGRRKGMWVSPSCQRLALGEGRVSVVCFVLLCMKWKVACPSVVLPWRGLALKPPGALCKGGLLSLIMTHRQLIAKLISKRPRKELLSRRNDHKQWWITKELFFSWQQWECDDSNWVKRDNGLRKRKRIKSNYEAVLFILYLTPDRIYIVVDRAHGREELVLDGDRRKRLCREEILLKYLFSSWTREAEYVRVLQKKKHWL